MRQPDPDEAAALRQAKPLDEAEGVEVAIPDGDALGTQRNGDVVGGDARHGQRRGGRPMIESGRVGDAEELHTVNRHEAVVKSPVEHHFRRPDRIHCRGQFLATRSAVRRSCHDPDVFEVRNRRERPGIALEIAGACFEPGVGWADLVRRQRGQDRCFPIDGPDMGTEELVDRTRNEIRVHRAGINGQMRGGMDGIDVGPGSHGVGSDHDLRDGIDGPDGIRRPTRGNETGPGREDRLEILDMECAVVQAGLPPADDQIAILCHRDPWVHVRGVIKTAEDDLVTRPERPGYRAAQVEGERGHIGAEDDLLGGNPEQIRDGGMRVLDDRVRELRSRECPAVIRVGRFVVASNGINHRLRDLRSARAVEVDEWSVPVHTGEGREAGSEGIDVEGRHGTDATGRRGTACATCTARPCAIDDCRSKSNHPSSSGPSGQRRDAAGDPRAVPGDRGWPHMILEYARDTGFVGSATTISVG